MVSSCETRNILVHGLDGQGDALAAADAERDDAAIEAVATHGMDQLRGEYRPGGADRMAVGHRAAFHIDDIVGQTELARDHDRDRGEGFIHLDPLNRPTIPSRTLHPLFAPLNQIPPDATR